MLCHLMQILDSEEKPRQRSTYEDPADLSLSLGPRRITHLFKVRHVQQGGDLQCLKELGKVSEDIAGLRKQAAEPGDDMQQGAEQATGLRREQGLQRETNTTGGPELDRYLPCVKESEQHYLILLPLEPGGISVALQKSPLSGRTHLRFWSARNHTRAAGTQVSSRCVRSAMKLQTTFKIFLSIFGVPRAEI